MRILVQRQNVAEYVRKLHTDFGRKGVLSARYVRDLVKKVKEIGILIDKPKRKPVHKPENIPAEAESVCEAPSTSIHRRSQELNINKTNFA